MLLYCTATHSVQFQGLDEKGRQLLHFSSTYNSGVDDRDKIRSLVHNSSYDIIVSQWCGMCRRMTVLFSDDIKNRLLHVEQDVFQPRHIAVTDKASCTAQIKQFCCSAVLCANTLSYQHVLMVMTILFLIEIINYLGSAGYSLHQ